MKIILRKILLLPCALFCILYWLYASESGLKTIVASINLLYKGKISITNANGKINQTIELQQIVYTIKSATIKIDRLTVKFAALKQLLTADDIVTLHATDITLEEASYRLFKQDLSFANSKLAVVTATIAHNKQQLNVNITELHGTWQGYPLQGKANIKKNNEQLTIDNAEINIADNSCTIHTATDATINWAVNLQAIEQIIPPIRGAITATGKILTQPQLTVVGEVTAQKLQLMALTIGNSKADFQLSADPNAPLSVNCYIATLQYDTISLQAIKLVATGSTALQQVTLELNQQQHKFVAALVGARKATGWHATINKFTQDSVTIGNWQLVEPCTLTIDNTQTHLSKCRFAADDLNATLTANASLDHTTQNINAEVIANSSNIAWLMQWLPNVTRLKGKVASKNTISGQLAHPTFTTDTNLTNITMTMPKFGVKIKPLALHLRGNSREKFLLSGAGKMRKGPGSFKISGFIDVNKPNMPHSISIVGENVEFIKTESYHLIANPNLAISFKNLHTLQVGGKLQILSGLIDLNHRSATEVHRSQDIHFKGQPATASNNQFEIIPDLQVRIENKVKLKGLGLSAIISGKLKISKSDQQLRGDGRISAKKGSYKITGQKLYIHYGKLYYPPGTLLSNPFLDIKISKNKPFRDSNEEKGSGFDDNKTCLYIQGTWNNPIIQDNGLIKNDQAIAQILNFGSGSLITKLQKKFKLSEFSIAPSEVNYDPMAQQNKNDAFLDNKNLVIGKKLNKKVYLQYSKGLMDASQNTVKVKYLFNKNWSIAVETGTVGNGADLSFSIDND